MKTNNLLAILKTILLGYCFVQLVACGTTKSTASKAVSTVKKSIPDMLENTIEGVVTIGVFETGKRNKAFGFGEKSLSPADVAFKKALDLSGAEGSGSGFMILHKGKKYVVTNAHVIETALEEKGAIQCFSTSREKYPLKIVGGDTFYDIAILAFDGKDPGLETKTLKLAQKEARLGEQVYAIGNPLGTYPYSVTEGIVGGKNRLYTENSLVSGKFGFLQHSASVIWGNSGGPLVNTKGEVVGVNSWIEIKRNQVISQLNFAVDLYVLETIIPEIIEKGRVQRASLGIEFASIRGWFGYGPPVIQSVLSSNSVSKSLASKIGKEVTKINTQPVKSLEDILMVMEFVRAGDIVSIELEDGTIHRLTASTMTEEHLEELTKDFFETYTNYDVSEGGEFVVLTAAMEDALMGEVDEENSYIENKGKEQYALFAAGEAGNFLGGGTQFRVSNLADFGRILRLTSLNGHFDGFVMDENGDTDEICWYIKDEDGNKTKALFY